MSARPGVAYALFAAAVTALSAFAPIAPAAAAAQEAPAGEAPRVELSRDTVDLGDAFELRLVLPLPEGRAAYFPDTLPAGRSVESLGPAEWRLEATAGGGRALTVVYPLIGLRAGAAELPPVEILTGPAGPGEPAVGAWSDARAGAGRAALTRHVASGPEVWIASVLDAASPDALVPRPADDVVGASRSPGTIVAALMFAALLAWAAGATAHAWLRERRRARGPAGPVVDPLEAAREAALAALDELRRLGLAEAGRVDELYGRSSAAVRSYVEHLHAGWGPALTSSELMRDLAARANGDAAPELHREMRVAEVVKFGRLRPDAEEADRHLSTLRGWVARPAPRLER